ncbi:MAG: hypothetical protein ACRD3J_31790 [Thermoanaerobaculia bacterium]
MRLILFLTLLTTFIVARENGSCIDPDGRCKASFMTDQGPGIDPDGFTVDAGPRIDPEG